MSFRPPLGIPTGMPGGDVLYLQASAENLGYYVRVVPDWVKTMKRVVDEANR